MVVDSSPVVHVTDSTFQDVVIESDSPVLVDFWAPWCGPCRLVGPVVEEIAHELNGQVKVVKVNIDDSSQAASQYGIRSIPSLLVFKDGRPVETVVGAVPKAKLMTVIEKHL